MKVRLFLLPLGRPNPPKFTPFDWHRQAVFLGKIIVQLFKPFVTKKTTVNIFSGPERPVVNKQGIMLPFESHNVPYL